MARARAAAAKADGKAAKPKSAGRRKKQGAEPASRGLAATELVEGAAPPKDVASLRDRITADGGAVIGVYREPVGGHWSILAGVPIDKVAPTPFQRDISETHVKRLANVIDRLDRFLDPIIATRNADGTYWTPNGHHRLQALRQIGGRSIVALVLPDEHIAYQILALNTEKAHNLREKSLEVVRMVRSLAELDPRPEKDFALEFEEPSFLTLGLCYEERGRFSGGAYQSMLRQVDAFRDEPLPEALRARKAMATRLLEVDDAVVAAVARLRERGLESPYLKAFVVARVNPLRFQRGAAASFDATVDKMLASAQKLDAGSIRADQVARTGGPPPEEG